MNTNNRNERNGEGSHDEGSHDGGFDDLLDGLEQIARNLDAQAYSGRAWPVARRFSSRRLKWVIAASLAAAAAIVAMIVPFHLRPRIGAAPAGDGAVAVAPGPSENPSPDELAVPDIVIVEDADSYSIIDMTTGVPLVSYATKDSYRPECVVPLVLEQPKQSTPPATQKVKKI